MVRIFAVLNRALSAMLLEFRVVGDSPGPNVTLVPHFVVCSRLAEMVLLLVSLAGLSSPIRICTRPTIMIRSWRYSNTRLYY